MEQAAFFVKCHPQDADIVDLAREVRRVFIGYPPFRQGGREAFNPRRVRDAVVDISSDNETWTKEMARLEQLDRGYRSKVTQNRNMALSIAKGSVAVVPRPGRGLVYAGRTSGAFELVHSPAWANRYLEIRKALKLEAKDAASHVGDVVQTWPIDAPGLVAIPFPLLPGWISYQLLSRQTAGWIYDNEDENGATALGYFERLLDDRARGRDWHIDLTPTNDMSVVAERLVHWLTPASFEHLMVTLLQLEETGARWIHVGGSGDGGVDGLGFRDGSVSGALQCKWRYQDDAVALGRSVASELEGVWGKQLHRINVAILYPKVEDRIEGNVAIIGRSTIARLLVKHAKSIPHAAALGIVPR